MKPTDEEKERMLRGFFAEHLAPLAETARARGIEFFPTRPSDGVETYYHSREDGGDYVSELTDSALSSELEDIWQDARLPELRGLVGPLLTLAAALHTDDDSDDVSPFIYAMF